VLLLLLSLLLLLLQEALIPETNNYIAIPRNHNSHKFEAACYFEKNHHESRHTKIQHYTHQILKRNLQRFIQ